MNPIFANARPEVTYKKISKKRKSKNSTIRKKQKVDDEPTFIIVKDSGAFAPSKLRTCADPADFFLSFNRFDVFETRFGGSTNNFPDLEFVKLPPRTRKGENAEEWIWMGWLKSPFQKYENAPVKFREIIKKELKKQGFDQKLWKEFEAMLFY